MPVRGHNPRVGQASNQVIVVGREDATGIGLNSPADVHYGLAADKAIERSAVLTAARSANPEGLSSTTDLKIPALPGMTWINKPGTHTLPQPKRTPEQN
jgi:hypothetical protein